uniref:Uncharacterized protein n=1 Tax=Oncorhynchus mykiss TaxID=8022 RepID=A0A8K9XGE5_ONCMY
MAAQVTEADQITQFKEFLEVKPEEYHIAQKAGLMGPRQRTTAL